MSQIVAIVGRPNVGKSTLFNRLIGQSEAIIDDIAGITRDRHYGSSEWNGHVFTVIDTGGYSVESGDQMDKLIAEQAEIAISEANLILFVVDVKTGINAQDALLADLLRKQDKPVLVVANKADNSMMAQAAYEHHALGVGEVFPVSATHGSGTGELLDAITGLFPPVHENSAVQEEEAWPKIALIGKPNVGKSTFLNALIGEKRSIVGEKPHTTRTPVHTFYRLYNKRFILVDTAGIRKKNQVAKKSLEFYAVIRSIRAIEQSDVCIMLLDVGEGLSHQDKNIIELAMHKHKGLLIVVNKWDLIEKTADIAHQYKKKLVEELAYIPHVPILFTSGLTKKGIYQTIERAIQVYEHRSQRLSTATLNKILIKATSQHPPPILKGKHVKMNYVTQLPTAWPSFAIFCNLPQYIPENYKRYLEKQFRLHADLAGVPITFVFKKK